jgi:hypothetical protein
MTDYSWAQGFVDTRVCHIQTVYPGGERSTYVDRTRVFVAICGAWLGPEPIVIPQEKPLPRCKTCELRVKPLP